MINSIRKRYFKIHLVFLLTSILFSVLIYLLFWQNLQNYNSKEIYFSETYSNYKSIYIDLNHNGNSEKLTFGKSIDTELYFVVIHNDNGTLLDQFNFFNKTIISSSNSYDFDDDNFDEVFVFTRGDSTLFISVIDVKNKVFRIKEQPIFKKPKNVTTPFWDLKRVFVKFNDIDKDGNLEMYLSPLTAHAIYPRGLYVYDIKTFELLKQFPTTAVMNEFKFFDMNEDGFDEIIIDAASSGNTRDYVGFHDQNNWLLILDKDLNLIRDPLIMGEFLTGFSSYVVDINGDEKLLVIFTNHKNSKPADSFSIYDFELHLETQQLLKPNSIVNFAIKPGVTSQSFYIAKRSGQIAKYDLNFNEICSVQLPLNSYGFLYIGELCEEEGLEVVVWNVETILVLSSDMKLLSQKSFDSLIENFSINQRYDEPYPRILVDTDQSITEFKLEKNILGRLIIPVLIGLIFLFYLAILFLHRVISRITRTLGAYNYSNDDINLGLIITDLAGNVKSYNKNIFYNLPPDSNIHKNKSVFSVFNKTTEIVDAITEAFKSEKETIKQMAFTKDDFRFIGKVQVLPLFTMFRIPHAFVIKIQNFTQQIENDRASVWSKISQKIAHDIKTPLSTIQLNLSALKSRLADDAIIDKTFINDDISMIQNEVKQITELTKGFLKFSNLEKPNIQLTDIKELINNSIKPFAHYFENGIKFVSEISEDADSVWADPNQMIQLLHIFIENAIDAVSLNGQIKIVVNLVDDLQHLNGGYVEILISDNGKGISDKELNKVFEPYFTNKKDGTGMGLTIAKKIIEDHNGKIDINSKPNLGTTVTIYLPYNQEIKND